MELPHPSRIPSFSRRGVDAIRFASVGAWAGWCWSAGVATVRQGRADVADVRAFISELYGPSLHAKRIASLAGATLGVMRAEPHWRWR
jgi:hypothetical protein